MEVDLATCVVLCCSRSFSSDSFPCRSLVQGDAASADEERREIFSRRRSRRRHRGPVLKIPSEGSLFGFSFFFNFFNFVLPFVVSKEQQQQQQQQQ